MDKTFWKARNTASSAAFPTVNVYLLWKKIQKGITMNNGTKLRTIARVIASLNTAVYAVSAGIAGLGFNKLTVVWAVLTIIVDFAVAFITTYYNNDYTVEGATGTKVTRDMKEIADTQWEPAEEPEDAEVGDENDNR